MWAIKQIDTTTLHLCGEGTLESNQKRRVVLEALHCGQYQGAVRIGDSGLVINSRQLAAVVPLESLRLVDDNNCAEWQERLWVVSHVPQRMWLYEGNLVTEPNPSGASPALISREDVSRIRNQARLDTAPPGEVVFRPGDSLEDPEKDIRVAIEDAQKNRKNHRRPQ
ncbi:hypothetical protein H1D44_20535 [Halomonas kenyensis]|uniref:Uncharacterized protein n=1 Tax=Billgrantia kenyensis TaxID=321266 RepID=A0A7W0AGC0_9GAMM|nr:hypothetical protein [Halomonas kenyensis]MBA2781256.1 hypothetical protein [Halomonas kenyensis]MCG6663924.1 hypothetical protein [Halomonas kenyensis]